ncbi:hypothetical protein VIGAN_08212500 [Vigna angularis var. angularis]|uniref:Uncharacterized protein n=1 Tax=Vigna angularis var. angularis TaxID=157739 RepID=A0A0S3SRF7_PHAAN|nr:hypothetical protein VIGAN_08212500 [Vigna angularis var. angularis]
MSQIISLFRLQVLDICGRYFLELSHLKVHCFKLTIPNLMPLNAPKTKILVLINLAVLSEIDDSLVNQHFVNKS